MNLTQIKKEILMELEKCSDGQKHRFCKHFSGRNNPTVESVVVNLVFYQIEYARKLINLFEEERELDKKQNRKTD